MSINERSNGAHAQRNRESKQTTPFHFITERLQYKIANLAQITLITELLNTNIIIEKNADSANAFIYLTITHSK